MTLYSFKQVFLMITIKTTLERKRETERLKERIYSQWKVIKIVDKSQLFIYSVNLKEMFSETLQFGWIVHLMNCSLSKSFLNSVVQTKWMSSHQKYTVEWDYSCSCLQFSSYKGKFRFCSSLLSSPFGSHVKVC